MCVNVCVDILLYLWLLFIISFVHINIDFDIRRESPKSVGWVDMYIWTLLFLFVCYFFYVYFLYYFFIFLFIPSLSIFFFSFFFSSLSLVFLSFFRDMMFDDVWPTWWYECPLYSFLTLLVFGYFFALMLFFSFLLFSSAFLALFYLFYFFFIHIYFSSFLLIFYLRYDVWLRWWHRYSLILLFVLFFTFPLLTLL